MLEELHGRARAGWLAVVLMGLVMLGSVPFYAGARPRGWFSYAPINDVYGVGDAGLVALTGSSRIGRLTGGFSPGLADYWLVAVPLAFLLLAGWFAFRGRRTGLQLRWPWYVGTGLLLFSGLLLTVLPVSDPLPHTVRTITTPLLLVVGSLWVLGWVEKDRRLQVLSGLGAVAAVYVGFTGRGGGIAVPDVWLLEPLLSAATSPQGAVALLGLVFVGCGAMWRPRRP